MTGTILKNSWARAKDCADYYVGFYARATSARLTQVAVAVYESERVKHFREGAGQILLVPAFIGQSKQTQSLISRALHTNILFYLIPAILSQRLAPALRQTEVYGFNPDLFEYGAAAIDILLLLFMVRLFLRRQENNLKFIIAYPRVIRNDIDKLLPQILGKELAYELNELFNHLFKKPVSDNLQENLSLDIQKLFAKFFSQSGITANTFLELKIPLVKILQATLKPSYKIDSPEFLDAFSNQLVDELIKLLAKDFLPATFVEQKPVTDALFTALSWRFKLDESREFALEIRERLLRVKTKVQELLPVVYYPPCQCKETNVIAGTTYPSFEYYRKTALSELSYGPYKLGNELFTYIPNLLQATHVISPEVFFLLQLASFFARALNAGFYQNGLKIPSHCTRHRTEENNRHRMYALGVGLSQYALTELFAQAILSTTGVRNFCTDDAGLQLVIQFMTIATLANNHRLPGTGEYPWNPFFLSQRAMRGLLNQANSILASMQQSPEELLANLKYIGNILKVGAWVIWGPGAIFPAMPTAKNKQLLLQNDSMHFILQLFRHDIESMLNYIENARTVSGWLTRPVSWVAPSIFMTVLVIAAKLLNDATLISLLTKVKVELKKIELEESKTIHAIEEEPEAINLIPAIVEEEPIPVLTFQIKKVKEKEPATLAVQITDVLASDIRDFNPPKLEVKASPKAEKLSMASAISTESYFSPPEPKPRLPVEKDGFEWVEPSVSSTAFQRNSFLGDQNLRKKSIAPSSSTILKQKLRGLYHS